MDGEGGRRFLNRDRSLPVWLLNNGFFRVIHRLSTALTPGFGVIHRMSTSYPQHIHRVIHNRYIPK
jgi:hypothetical protein